MREEAQPMSLLKKCKIEEIINYKTLKNKLNYGNE